MKFQTHYKKPRSNQLILEESRAVCESSEVTDEKCPPTACDRGLSWNGMSILFKYTLLKPALLTLVSLGVGARNVTVNATGCEFKYNSRK